MWHSCKEMLAQEIPAQQFATWIKPLKMRESDSALRIEVSNRFKLDWVRAQYLQRIVEVLEQMAGRAVPVELCIASRSKAGAAPVRRQLGASPEQPADALSASVAATPTKATAKAATKSSAKASAKITEKTAPKASATASSSTEAQLAPVSEADIPNYGIAVGMPAEQDPRSRARLDPRYTFDALVEGSANRMARAAAMHVATSPGELYNPLFIYGGVGLGKTHLLHAVGHLLLDRRPQAQVLYTHAEQFVTDVVTASRRGNKRTQLLLEALCSTGTRVSELQFITAEAVRRHKASIRCKGKCREILLPAELCHRLTRWCQKHRIHAGPVFLSRVGKPLSRVTVWKLLKALCERANVAGKKVFPHNLRHLFARTFYNLEKNISKLADLLGHSSIETTRIYIMESGAEHERLLNKMHLLL